MYTELVFTLAMRVWLSPLPLTVESHVLGEALTENQFVPISSQLPETSCIPVQVTGGKPLVGHVHKHHVVPRLARGVRRGEGRGGEGRGNLSPFNPLPTIGNSLKKQKSLYKVLHLVLNPHINSYELMTHICVIAVHVKVV